VAQQGRAAVARGEPDHAAQHAHDDALDQELREHVRAAGADGQADADLAGPLRHAHQHDVHDPDAAHDKRNHGHAGEQRRHRFCRGGLRCGNLLLIAHGEIVVATFADIVALAEQGNDLLLRRGQVARAGDLGVDIPQRRSTAHDPLHGARVGHDHDVILIGSLRTETLRCQNAGYLERHVFDPQHLAHDVVAPEDLGRGRATYHADLVRAADVLLRERRAIRQRPLPKIKIIGGLAINPGEPILVARRDLGGGNNFFAHQGNGGDLATNRFRVLNLEGARASPAGANTARGSTAGKNQDHVFPKARDLRFHLRLRTRPDANHGNHRADANDDAEGG
jgi:hypothetical protein